MERREETKIVKRVLASLGIQGARVKHGTGTGWGWLKIYLPEITTPHRCIDKRIDGGQPILEMTDRELGGNRIYYQCVTDCPACREGRERDRRVTNAVMTATNRTGEYDGRVSVQS